ncbi:hypothetical protein Tcan_14049 [Toxocara canis]|uniref:G-protein coupled receptors family 1 profile domain-containing protein n=1 Tax=Toxocara canis TaxID=6265 RepID=A0A0B2VHU7_TOXCA|nr:hypothetical protein Tcan_14049 [Toxocara canis]
MIYELTHQAFVFWFPSLLLFISYLLIMIRLLHYTFRPTHDERKQRPRSASSLLRTRMTSFEKSQLISEELAASPICCKGPFFHLLRFGEKHCENSGFFFDDSVRSRCPSNSTEQNRSRAATLVSCSGSTLRRSRATPLWRRQLRSRMFLTSLTVVAAHIALWLPYNIISTSRFINFEFYTWASEHGGRLLEDLIIVNSLINPLIYGCGA